MSRRQTWLVLRSGQTWVKFKMEVIVMEMGMLTTSMVGIL